MKRLFLSLCLIVPIMWGTSHMHADAADAAQEFVTILTAEEAAELGIAQAAPIPKGRPADAIVYPRSHFEIQEMFSGPVFKMIHSGDTLYFEEGTHLRLDDESIWQVSNDDRFKLSKWRPSHFITFHPNYVWMHEIDKDFPYMMHNVNTKETVQVKVKTYCAQNKSTMPMLSRTITSEQYLVLDNGTCWYIPAEYFFRKVSGKWENGDLIMIGVEKNWWAGSQNCLINLSKKDACEAMWVPLP